MIDVDAVVLQRDRIGGTALDATPALDAADLADFRHGLEPVFGGTEDHHPGASRNEFQHVAGAGFRALAAARTLGGVHPRKAPPHFDGVERAHLHAVPEAEARIGARIRTAHQTGGRRTRRHTLIIVAQGHVARHLVTAAERHQRIRGRHRLAGQFAHRDACFRTSGAAAVRGHGGVRRHGGRIAFAARVAAAAAIRAGQGLQHGLHARVFLNMEDAGRHGEHRRRHQPEPEEHQYRYHNHNGFPFL